ncbi:glycoside hydrolase family 79 protein [Amniculicola lignicola CBS 123094]|uniref:Glycoside hydrolase family 79 protein n=1 Tax=Amniculicola lignicola CBS 123094 TaxID=1392246 RepID=A0A6A5VWV0_9PLEO|nr:glycoside hydrolase family 79 protein [Amniculicola lignicola CBS 123094]
MLGPRSLPVAIYTTLLFPTHLAFAQTSASVSAAPKASKAAVSSPLDPSFAGFGIEPSNLFSFTGNDETNTFSVQLLQNLADHSGAPPHIRLGGNTQDYIIYDASYTSYGWEDNANSQSQGAIAADSMIIGPGYIGALDRFPKDTPVTFGLNLAYSSSDYIERIVTTAKAAVDGIKNVKLYSFEIGNEPDLYL